MLQDRVRIATLRPGPLGQRTATDPSMEVAPGCRLGVEALAAANPALPSAAST
jgi:hypothetical protein